MWTLTQSDLQQLAGGGGERYAHFVDRLIRATGAKRGFAQSNIRTQLRTNIPDGGVDTEVTQPILSDDSGFFAVPTCWQYKALTAADVSNKSGQLKASIIKELHKPYVKQLIQLGYGYRLSILGDTTAEKVAKWEAQLNQEIIKINPAAPASLIVSGGQLVAWGEQFPAIVIWLRGGIGKLLHFETWGINCRSVTKTYVPNPDWDRVRLQILEYADFTKKIVGGRFCRSVQGAAGVGKTRFVYETLAELIQANALVVYTDDVAAAMEAIVLAANNKLTAIIVADECSPNSRFDLDQRLRGFQDTIRVICLDNSVGQFAAQEGDQLLADRELINTAEIVDANFDEVPRDRRHQYVNLSGGFIRLAADMCLHDAQLASGELGNYLTTVQEYVGKRLVDEQSKYLSLIALFDKVGIREDVRGEAGLLCDLLNLRLFDLDATIDQTREVPGFVVRAGRYVYVTPDIVARILFHNGWRLFVKPDVRKFCEAISETQKNELFNRAAKYGDDEVRGDLTAFFRGWFDNLRASSLADPNSAEMTASLIEASPREGLPLLEKAILEAPSLEVAGIADQANPRHPGCRRTLVWLLEDLVSFPEYFPYCESILFKFALNESEPGISNNSIGVWCDLFNIYLSGTATPFADRLKVLKERSASVDSTELQLVFRAVTASLTDYQTKTIRRPIVSGRLRPRDWQPSSREELNTCYSGLVDLCVDAFSGRNAEARQLAFATIITSLPQIIELGMLTTLRANLLAVKFTDDENRTLLNQLDEHLERVATIEDDTGGQEAIQVDPTAKEWAESLRPTDPDGRLRSVCSRDPWDSRFSRESDVQDEMDELAEWIVEDPINILNRHLEWLNSDEARSAERLAVAIARHEPAFDCGQIIFQNSISSGDERLLRGYLRGFIFSDRQPSEMALRFMDELETAHPETAFNVLIYAGDKFDAFRRIEGLAKSGRVPKKFLVALSMGLGRRALSILEIEKVLELLWDSEEREHADATNASIRFLRTMSAGNADVGLSLFDSSKVQSLSFELLERAVRVGDGRVPHDWANIAQSLIAFDPQRVTKILANAVVSDSASLSRSAEKSLARYAEQFPAEIMTAFGELLSDKTNGWRLRSPELRKLIATLPARVVEDWVRTHGLAGARSLARHLPGPYVDEKGNSIVPSILAFVFQEFDDDEVIQSFIEGRHLVEFWNGSGERKFRAEAEDARKFLSHPIRGIRKWAEVEVRNRSAMADYEKRHDEERFL